MRGAPVAQLPGGCKLIPETLVPWLALAALVVALLGFIMASAALRSSRRASGPAPRLMAHAEPNLQAEIQRIDRLGADLSVLAGRLQQAEAQGRRSMQRVGVVRYNPFADTGSNQSFVLAVLDAKGDGFILSGLHSRQQTRVFLKSVTAGMAETQLSDEEMEAIKQASS